jgi:hypothetical protein
MAIPSTTSKMNVNRLVGDLVDEVAAWCRAEPVRLRAAAIAVQPIHVYE